MVVGLDLHKRLEEPFDINPPVMSMQVPYEINLIQRLYQQLKPKTVVEIGSFHGGTLYGWLKLAEQGTIVHSIDPYIPPDLPPTWHSWVPSGIELIIHHKKSRDMSWTQPIDWLYIDGSHEYDDVLYDWQHYGSLVANGVVIFHDIYQLGRLYSGHAGLHVWRLWDDIRRAGYVTQEVGVHQDYFGTGIVYKGRDLCTLIDASLP